MPYISSFLLVLFAILACCVKSGFAQEEFCAVPVPGEVFCDDFSDGNPDPPPVQWTPSSDYPGDYDATSGDYVFTPTNASGSTLVSEVLGTTLGNTSMRSQVRISAASGHAGLTVRNQNHTGDTQNYVAGINWTGGGETRIYVGRNDPGDGQDFYSGVFVLPSINVKEEDVIIQLDAIGSELRYWAWRAGDPMPDKPQIVVPNDTTYSLGTVRLWSIGGINDSTSTFRFVQVATIPIPEPSTATLSFLGLLSLLAWRRKKPPAA